MEDTVRKFASVCVLFGLCAMPALAGIETYINVPVVDVNCSQKTAAAPDSHTRACALKCEASGFGILTKDNRFLKFDAQGNYSIVEALKCVRQERSSPGEPQWGRSRGHIERCQTASAGHRNLIFLFIVAKQCCNLSRFA
jgi:hypothetical protein